MAKRELSQDEVIELLNNWVESEVQVLVRTPEDEWLARFAGTLGIDRGGGVFAVHVGGPEAWVGAVTHTFQRAALVDEDVLVISSRHAETTIRKPRDGWPK
jgi:hypothetical protein